MRKVFSESDSGDDANFSSAAYCASPGTSDDGSLSTREWRERTEGGGMLTERYARHTMTLLADHRDGQQRVCLGGNPLKRPGERKTAGKKRTEGERDGAGQRVESFRGGAAVQSQGCEKRAETRPHTNKR